MRSLVIALSLLVALVLPAAAQQQPDPAVLQKALAAVQAQRDRALNEQVNSMAQAAMLTDEVAKLKAENEELKQKLAPAPKADAKK